MDPATAAATAGNVLTIKTVQIAPFRVLMTALKDILTETNIVFQSDGIRIVNMDKSHTVLVHLHLAADKFELYNCKKNKIVIGVTMMHLHKLINPIENNDTLTIYIEEGDYNDGIVSHLTLKFENGHIKQCKTQKLQLIEPDAEDIRVPDVTFSSIINMPSADFQKIIRDLSSISDKLEICSVGHELIFRCSGQFASAEIRRMESNDEAGSMSFISSQSDSSKIVQGVFSLTTLGYFVKCTNLCTHIEVYLDNNLPLIVKYNVASLGEIRMALGPLPK
jgi:proliferating cell nuclear antigen